MVIKVLRFGYEGLSPWTEVKMNQTGMIARGTLDIKHGG